MCKYYLGLDIGRTFIRTALLDLDQHKLIKKRKTPFIVGRTAEEEVKKNIVFFIREALRDFKILAVGISFAGILDRKNGIVENWPNNRLWNEFPLLGFLEDNFSIPFKIEDDANSAALGEFRFGAGKGQDNLLFFTVGSGVGCGIIIDGKLYKGLHGKAGEIGHIRVSKIAAQCECGKKGCLQAFSSGLGILRRSKKIISTINRKIVMNELKDINIYAEKKENWALNLLEESGVYLGHIIAILILALDIPIIVLGGGVLNLGNSFLDPLERGIRLSINDANRKIKIKPAKLGDYAGIYGVLSLLDRGEKNESKFKNNSNY